MCNKFPSATPDSTVRPARHPDFTVNVPMSPPPRYDEIAPLPYSALDATPRVRAALTAVEDVLAGLDSDAGDLWAILTALRGPDEERTTNKYFATVPVRRAAFPRLAQNSFRSTGMLANFGSEYSPPIASISFDYPYTHFKGHIISAVAALSRTVRRV